MDIHGGSTESERLKFEAAGFRDRAADAQAPDGRPGPGWRAWVLSIIAAIVLSVAATLLLGGSFRLPASNAAAGGCGAGGPCCPPQSEGGR